MSDTVFVVVFESDDYPEAQERHIVGVYTEKATADMIAASSGSFVVPAPLNKFGEFWEH